MSIEATAYVTHLTHAPDGTQLSGSEKLVMYVLADHHNPTHRVAWPSVPTIARCALMSERQVQNTLRALERRGLIATDVRARNFGRGQTLQYILVQLEKGAGYSPFSGDREAPKAGEKPVEMGRKPGSEPTVKGEGRVQEEGRKGCKKGEMERSAIRKNLEPTTELGTKAAPATAVAPQGPLVEFSAEQIWGLVLRKLKDRMGIDGAETYDRTFRDTVGERVSYPQNGNGRSVLWVRWVGRERPDLATMYRYSKDTAAILKALTGRVWHVTYAREENRNAEVRR